MFAVVRVRVPPSARLLPLSVTEELASLSFAMLPASCALVTEMFITLLEKSAPAVAPVSMPANLVFSDEVKLTSDCVSADRTPVVLLIVRLVPTLIPPRTSASAFGNENKLAFASIPSNLVLSVSVKLFCVSPPSPTVYCVSVTVSVADCIPIICPLESRVMSCM